MDELWDCHTMFYSTAIGDALGRRAGDLIAGDSEGVVVDPPVRSSARMTSGTFSTVYDRCQVG